MKKYITILFLIIATISSHAQISKKKLKSNSKASYTVAGTLTESFQYCGGAPPPEEMLKELNTPKPLGNYQLFLRLKINDILQPIYKSVTTDSLGRFSFKLAPGKYSVVDIKKKDTSVFNQTMEKYKSETDQTAAIDVNCFITYISKPDFVIDIPLKPKKSTIVITHNYFRTCEYSGSPCVEFRGAMPQ